MKILVLGRQGQLARALADAPTGQELHFVGHDEVDLTVAGESARAIARHKPDLVINTAAYTAVDQAEEAQEACERLNADAPGELAAAAAERGIPIVHISTDYVFDGLSPVAYRENDTVGPQGAYGRSKLAGERAVAAANPRHLVLRTAWLVSPWGRNFVRTILSAAAIRDELKVVSDQRGSPTSAIDLAAGILAAVRKVQIRPGDVEWGVYHLAGKGEASWFELAEAVMTRARELGLRSVPIRPIRTAEWPTPAIRPANSVLDSSRFGKSFNFEMPDWRISIGAIVERIVAGDADREA